MYDAEHEAENREMPQTMRATYEKTKCQFCRVYTVKIQDNRQEQLEVPIEAGWLEKTILPRTMERHDIKVRPCGTKKKTVVLASSMPTTESWTFCARLNDEMSLRDRTFRCSCGVEKNKDIHAAGNMVRLYENNVGGEHTNLKRVKMKALAASDDKTGSVSFNP